MTDNSANSNDGGLINIPIAKYKCDSDGFLNFRFKTIVSPDEFYIAPCDPHLTAMTSSSSSAQQGLGIDSVEEQTFHRLSEEMNRFYCRPENQRQIDAASTLLAQQNDRSFFGVAQLNVPDDDDVGTFYRCRITKSRQQQIVVVDNCRQVTTTLSSTNAVAVDGGVVRQTVVKVNVFYVDLGLTERSKPANEIFVLDKRFCTIPARIMSCSLFATRPIEEGRRTKFGVWPSEAIAMFKRLCRLDQMMKATILFEESDRYGVVLYDVDSPGAPTIINNELTKFGVAKSDINWISFLDKQLHLLQRRHPPLPVVAEPISNVDVEELFENDLGPSTNQCQQQHQRFPYSVILPPCIEPPEKNSVVEVNLGCLSSCVHFWLYFLSGTEDVRKTKTDPALKAHSMKPRLAFDNLSRHINDPKFISHLPQIQPRMSVGDYCLAIYSQDGLFYRAKVINCFPDDDQYKVTYIDYGNSEYVSTDQVYPIPVECLQIPIMALECHLANVRPTTEAFSEENRNILVEKILLKPLKARIVDVVKRNANYPLLLIELRAVDFDNSFISVNSFIVEQGWAVLV